MMAKEVKAMKDEIALIKSGGGGEGVKPALVRWILDNAPAYVVRASRAYTRTGTAAHSKPAKPADRRTLTSVGLRHLLQGSVAPRRARAIWA